MGEKDLGHSRPLTEEILIAVIPASSYQPPVEQDGSRETDILEKQLADIPLEITLSGNISSPPVTRPRVVEVQIEPTSRHGVIFERVTNTFSALLAATKEANQDFEHRFVASLLRRDSDKPITLPHQLATTVEKSKEEESDGIAVTPDRKRKLREKAAPIIKWVARQLHDKFSMTADDATKLSVIGVATGLCLVMMSNIEKLSSELKRGLKVSGGVISTIFEMLDAVDGAIKRLTQQEQEEQQEDSAITTLELSDMPHVKLVVTDYGDVYDALADRAQETLSTLLRMYLADDIEGKRLALFSALSNTLPSIARALAVSRGVLLDEGGMGTRVERAVYQKIGVLLPRIGSIPVQKIVDAFNLSANIVRFVDRMIQIQNGPKPNKKPKEKPEVGARRMYYLLLTQAAITVVSLAVYKYLSSKMDKN